MSEQHSTQSTPKIWPLHGGIHPPENKAQSLTLPLGEIPLPEHLVLPLQQHIGTAAEAVVKVGERVLAGQMIAAAKGLVSAPVHASTSGVVVAIEKRPIAHPSGLEDDCIVIETDARDEWIELVPCQDYTALTHEQLLEKIRNAGIAGMGGAGFPTAVKLNPRANQIIDTLIINGTECEPYITADDILMQTHAEDIIAGVQLLAHMLGQPRHLLIGIEDNKPEAIAAMEKAAAGTGICIRVFPTKYPSGGEKQLIQILTGKEVPHGGLPADIGIVCQNIGSTFAAWKAVRFGAPLTSRVTTVVGQALQTQRNITALLGTPIEHILRQHGFNPERCSRLVMGGPMMGFALPTTAAPVVKTTNCILAPTEAELPAPAPAQACIRCGMCAQACPANLLPQQLYWYSQAQDYDKLQAYDLFDCIECGACAYICPSNIPLVQYYRASKGQIRQQEADRQKADRSRQRFEFRKQRIDKAEAEKEAKRLARKRAAEKAREQQSTAETKPDPVAQAMARVKARHNSPEHSPQHQREKLERAVASAEDRLRNAREKEKEKGTVTNENHLSPSPFLQARVKEAELKLAEAQHKLAEFNQSPEAGESTPVQDPVAAAIARAEAKLALSPREKLQANIETLEQRLKKAQSRLEKAQSENDENIAAFRSSVEKLQSKLEQVRDQLNTVTSE